MTMSQWWKVATALVVAVATASGVEWIGVGTGAGAQAPAEKRDREPRVAEAPTVEVRPGKVRLALKERGNVEAARNDDVYCNVEGGTTIIKLVPEGQVVKKGDTICELDSAALKDRLINQRITVKSAEANFLNARLTREVAELAVREARDVLRQDDEALKRAIDGGRAAIEKLEGRLKRNREASQRFRSAAGSAVHYEKTPADLIAEVDIQDRIEDVELRLEAERRSLTQAEGKREILRDSTVPKTIKALEVAVTKAHADELARQATWELEKSKEAKLERQIANCTLTAPRDGCVIYANDPSRMFGGGKQIEEGATVRERQKVVSIVNFNDPMRINAKVPEDVIAQVVPKMKARITIDAFPGLSFVGLVDEIAPLPDPYAFATWDRKVYSTRIRIGGGHPGLRPGMTATAEILLDERDDAIAVPVKAVARYDGKDHVAVKAPGGRVEWRDVVLGPSDGTIVEVKEGLRGGDHVFAEAEPLLGDEQRARRDAVVDPLGEKDAVPKKARGGARPRLFIVVADRAGVIRVPVKAVSHYDAKDHVVVIRPPTTEPRPGGAIEWRVVALGASDGTTVEVKGGLKSGERILLREAGLEKFRGGGRAGR